MDSRTNPRSSFDQTTGEPIKGRLAAIFPDRPSAQSAIRELKSAGFSSDDIGVATLADPDQSSVTSTERSTSPASEHHQKDKSFWQEIKEVFGASSDKESDDYRSDYNDFGGNLTGMGIPEKNASYYQSQLRSGGVLVTVRASGARESEARETLQRFGGKFEGAATGAQYQEGGVTDRSRASIAGRSQVETGDTANQRLELRGEILRVYKERMARGEVRLRKEVITEKQTFEVPVTREELVIERRPAQGREAATGSIGEGQEIRVPLSEEEVRVEKRPVVKEEVTIGKKAVQDSHTVSEDVRHEEVRVEGQGDVDVTGDQAKTTKRKKPAA